MAAVLRPQHLAPAPAGPRPAPADRPRLVVIEGGRSAAAVARRRMFLRRRVGALLVVVAAAVGLVQALQPSPPVGALPATHVVEPGETLWGIASALPVDADLRVLVDELAAANGGADVRAGQELVIPAALADLGR